MHDQLRDTPALLCLNGAGRKLAGRDVLHAIDIEIHPGDVLGLLGVNGAGKSTTLRLMAGVLAPDSGSVMLSGKDLYEHPELGRRQIGYLPEDPPLHSELTTQEFLCFCAQLHGLARSSIGSAVNRAIQRCDLGDVRRRLIGSLSKGFRQRVGIAQAILHEPDLIVLDEPASGLDPVQAHALRSLIRGLGAEHAVVLSTHLLGDVAACCSRVAILHEGHLRHQAALNATAAERQLRIGLARSISDVDWATINCARGATKLDEGLWRVTLHADADRADLAAAIVARGWGLLELREESSSLEDTFLRIASADIVQPEAA